MSLLNDTLEIQYADYPCLEIHPFPTTYCEGLEFAVLNTPHLLLLHPLDVTSKLIVLTL